MDVTTDCHWGSDWLHIGLLQEDLLCFLTEVSQVLLVEAFGLQQVSYALVDVHLFQIYSNRIQL